MSRSGARFTAALAGVCSLLVFSAPAGAQIAGIPRSEVARFTRQLAQEPPVYPLVIELLAAGDFAELRKQRYSSGSWRQRIAAREGHSMPGWMADVFAMIYGVAETTWWKRR